MMKDLNAALSKGIVLFTGYGIEKSPGEHPERILKEFQDDSAKMLDEIQRIFIELDQLKPDWSNQSLQDAGQWAKSQIKLCHPNLSDDALNALEWTFTWWWK